MAGVPIEAQVSAEQLIEAAAQLPPQELALFVARLLDLQARNQTAAEPWANAGGIEDQDIDIAVLSARVRTSRQRILGLNQGGITTTADFDAPLPDEFWLGNA